MTSIDDSARANELAMLINDNLPNTADIEWEDLLAAGQAIIDADRAASPSVVAETPLPTSDGAEIEVAPGVSLKAAVELINKIWDANPVPGLTETESNRIVNLVLAEGWRPPLSGPNPLIEHLAELATESDKTRSAAWLQKCAAEPDPSKWPPAPAYKGAVLHIEDAAKTPLDLAGMPDEWLTRLAGLVVEEARRRGLPRVWLKAEELPDSETEPLEPLVSTATTARRRVVHIAQTSTPRVFFPGDVVPAGTAVMLDDGSLLEGAATDEQWEADDGPVLELIVPTPEEFQSAVDRAKAARDGK